METRRDSCEEVKPDVAVEEAKFQLGSSPDGEVCLQARENDAVKQDDAGSLHGDGILAEMLPCKDEAPAGVNNERSMPMPSSGLNATAMFPAQLTIFYGDSVSVFNGIPPEKVHEILVLAAAAAKSAETKNIVNPPTSQALARSPSFQTTTALASPGAKLHFIRQSSFCRLQADVPIARRHSLQRFLEKRRDRFLNKSPYHTPSADKDTDEITDGLSTKTASDAGCLDKSRVALEKNQPKTSII